MPELTHVTEYPTSTAETLHSQRDVYQYNENGNTSIYTVSSFLRTRCIKVCNPKTQKFFFLYYKNLYAEKNNTVPPSQQSDERLRAYIQLQVNITYAQALRAELQKAYAVDHPDQLLPKELLETEISQAKHCQAIQEEIKAQFTKAKQQQSKQTLEKRLARLLDTFHDIQKRELGHEALRMGDKATAKACVEAMLDKFHAIYLTPGLQPDKEITQDEMLYKAKVLEWDIIQGMLYVASQGHIEGAYTLALNIIEIGLKQHLQSAFNLENELAKDPYIKAKLINEGLLTERDASNENLDTLENDLISALNAKRDAIFHTHFQPYLEKLVAGIDTSSEINLNLNFYQGLEAAHLLELLKTLIRQDIDTMNDLLMAKDPMASTLTNRAMDLYIYCLLKDSPLASATQKHIGITVSEGLLSYALTAPYFVTAFITLLKESPEHALLFFPQDKNGGFIAIESLIKHPEVTEGLLVKLISKWLDIEVIEGKL